MTRTDEEQLLDGGSEPRYGAVQFVHQYYQETNAAREARRAIAKRQRRLVAIVITSMLFIIICTFTWGIPLILANMAASQIEPEPSDSKEGFYKSAAVAADSTVCPQIGRSMLERGGSAVDAAIATLLCQGVVDPHRSGLGGGLYMLVYLRKNRTAIAVDARETAPSKATKDMLKRQGRGVHVAVPGELKGLWEAHKKFGVLPWAELVAPSIQLCEKGVVVSEHLATFLYKFSNTIFEDPVLRKTFTHPKTGWLLREGDIMTNPRLLKTLKQVSLNGAHAIYSGMMGITLAEEVRKYNGVMLSTDIFSYRTKWTPAVNVSLHYKRHQLTLHTTPLPSGGVLLAHILNIMDGYNIDPTDFHNVFNQMIVLHRTVEAFKFAFAKRPLLGDPEFSDLKVVFGELLSKTVAEKVRHKIEDYNTLPDSEYGPHVSQIEDGGTTHVSVVAPNGDAVAASSSINFNFGSGFMSDSTGIILNNEMDDFSVPSNATHGLQPKANFIAPGKRPLSSMTPIIITDQDGNVRLVTGGAGGIKIITSVAYVIMRNLWLGDTVKQAIDGKRIHHQFSPNVLRVENGMPEQYIEGLKERLHMLEEVQGLWSSHVNAIERRSDGVLVANSDFRKGGTVDGFDHYHHD
ncbi:scoloptoxin SSD14-like isoform X2 [Periplaneta americana]|uniref:scoloptoxin SSD14-like isoform X2 n=1 Tax=Periplaneta americana TaxID=6978 RepID=UPI0037E91DC3